MEKPNPKVQNALKRLVWPLWLTQAGLFAEQLVRAFWPVWSLALLLLSALMFGLQDTAPIEAVWISGVCVLAGLIWGLWRGIHAFRWPNRATAQARLDETLPGRPITALTDTQAIGSTDAASRQVWEAHVARMAAQAEKAQPVSPDLKLARRDPFALRYVALLALIMAGLFGSVLRVASVSEMAPGSGGTVIAGPTWEGWIEPPVYTGKPSLYLSDLNRNTVVIPQGSQITLRLYGEVGVLTVNETISARTGEVPSASDPSQSFVARQDGVLEIAGPGGQSWSIQVTEDAAPEITMLGTLERSAGGEFRLPFEASDDYGVERGRAEIVLDLTRTDRRYGLATAPEPRDKITLDLPLTISGNRRSFSETLVDDLALHPWAGLPITIQLIAEDAADQMGTTPVTDALLPARRFFDPMATAIVEQRRDLLWSRQNAPRVASVLRAISHEPADILRSETTYLKLRFAVRRLETAFIYATVTPELQETTAQVLWEIAVEIDEGDLASALERLQRAQDRLSDAIQNGATDEEIAELMAELQDAINDYMQQLAEQAGQDGPTEQAQNENAQRVDGDQLQEMLDRIQELMEQGRTDEAQALLDELRRMLENMQVAQGQQGQQGEGQQAMEDLAETLRDQQGLSDDAFRDLQDQFNQQGQQEGQQGQQGQPGDQQGQQQQGQGGQQPGQRGQQDGQTGGQSGQGSEQSLAERQQALRDRLAEQERNLPGAGTEEGQAARDALGRAGEAMDNAEEALRADDFAEAIDNQSRAIEALREGMRELGEALAQNEQGGQQGQAATRTDQFGQQDPLGREAGQNGATGTDQQLLQGEDVYRRARELLDEIRRRSGDQARPAEELDYLKRLLDRF